MFGKSSVFQFTRKNISANKGQWLSNFRNVSLRQETIYVIKKIFENFVYQKQYVDKMITAIRVVFMFNFFCFDDGFGCLLNNNVLKRPLPRKIFFYSLLLHTWDKLRAIHMRTSTHLRSVLGFFLYNWSYAVMTDNV